MRYELWAAIGAVMAYGCLCAGIAIDGLTDKVRPSDFAVVLGSKVEPDGRLSPRLAARLDKALSLYGQRQFGHVVVSGATGVEGVNEAVAMRSYLIARGLPSEAVVVDDTGATTMATALHAARLARENGWRSAIVVTQFFHVTRSRQALVAAGVAEVGSAHADYFELRDVYSLARESIALPWAVIKRRLPRAADA